MLTEPQDWMHGCTSLLLQGRTAEAKRLSEQALAEHPEDGRLWELRGLTLMRTRDLSGACEAFETAQSLVPLAAAAQVSLAECHARAGRVELAVDLYRALACDAACPSSLLPSVAAGLGSVGDHRGALLACRELAAREPGCHEAIFGQAFYLRRLGAPLTVIVGLVTKAHELSPASSLYRVTLGSILAELGRREEAYELLRHVNVNTIACRGCLSRMMSLFRHCGDAERVEACSLRADSIESPRDCARDCRPGS